MARTPKTESFSCVGELAEVADDLCGVAEEWRNAGGSQMNINAGFDKGQKVYFAHVQIAAPIENPAPVVALVDSEGDHKATDDGEPTQEK